MSKKGENLAILAAQGVPTPRGFVLAGDHYRAATSSVHDGIEAATGDTDAMSKLFLNLELSSDTATNIERELAKLTGAERFAVRSSGNVVAGGVPVDEDSTATALAGQFESFLSVPHELVPVAIRACWASLFNPRSIAAFHIDRAYIERSEMSVVVQEMVVASASAVMMTADPLGDGATGSIDLTVGACEALVAGLVSPDEVVFARSTGDILSYDIGRKERRVVYEDFTTGKNTVLLANSAAVSAGESVPPEVLRTIVDLGFEIEQIFGAPQDVELVVTRDGTVVITQARPVTTLAGAITPFTNTNHN